ncbi:DUF3095 family protein [Aureimonas leprariae]|uniref:DUF3095 domain-containing protein n=1 Tax=Plantimonas leprariae TaxID=2615207 RepID=A0A7V7TXF6_9HYPH|nr:DUF3095 family protein [Aureimonas leprariae]KAB0681489.1 DUF3095 domain-containing protein [Aureimonas leprariae]
MPGKAAERTAGFYAGLDPVEEFQDLAAIERYRPVPDGAVLFLADVVDSTGAIERGRYAEVNVAAAAVIAAVGNALPKDAAAFSFGGDGASFVVEREHEAAGRRLLGATVAWARRELDLELRAAAVPVAAIRAARRELLLARFAVTPTLAYAMFAGGGLAWAEERMKAGEYRVDAPAEPVPLDLSGLHCRFAEFPAKNGVILSVIVVPAGADEAAGFAAVATELLALAMRREADLRPVRDGAPRVEWSLAKFLMARKTAAARAGRRSVGALAKSDLFGALSNLIFRSGLSVGGFDPKRYLTDLVRNTDFRKFDDGLRMTIDCSARTADEIERFLAAERAKGRIRYGTHRQEAAVLTCFVPSPTASDHVHFVDGAAGGYAFAARALKRQSQAALA